jgi:hypothetical protein
VARIGRELLERGTFEEMDEKAIPYPEANAFFIRRDRGV